MSFFVTSRACAARRSAPAHGAESHGERRQRDGLDETDDRNPRKRSCNEGGAGNEERRASAGSAAAKRAAHDHRGTEHAGQTAARAA